MPMNAHKAAQDNLNPGGAADGEQNGTGDGAADAEMAHGAADAPAAKKKWLCC